MIQKYSELIFLCVTTKISQKQNFKTTASPLPDRVIYMYYFKYFALFILNRLRPRLQKACEKDLSKFCQDILLESGDDRDTSKDFLEGKVIQCLQTKFVTDPGKN